MPQPTWVLLLTMSIPLWLQCTIFWCTSSRIMHCHKAQIILDWFLEHDNEFTFLKWPPQSPDLNSIEHLWDVVDHGCGGSFASWMCSRQICSNCVMLSCQYGPKSLSNVSNTLLNRSQRIKTVLKAKGSPNRQWSMMRTYFDIMVGTAGYSVFERSINFPAWIGPMILTVQLLMSCEGISTTLGKIPVYLKDKTGSKLRSARFIFQIRQWRTESDNCIYTAINIGLSVSTNNS